MSSMRLCYRNPLDFGAESYPKGVVMVEMAGRDSVAAALAFLEKERADILPAFVRTGTEYGGEVADRENLRLLKEKAGDMGAKVLKPVGLVDHRWWWATVGRPNSVLVRMFGSWHICVGCHMYLHAIRAVFCHRTGIRKILSGERLKHKGGAKVNQTPEAVAAYAEVAGSLGVEIDFPIYRLDDERELERLVGSGWGEGERQWACVLSGNYLDEQGAPAYDSSGLKAYLERFLIPVTLRILEKYARGESPDHYSLLLETLAVIASGKG